VENYLQKRGMNPDYLKASIGFGSMNCKHDPVPVNGCQDHRKVVIIYFNTPLPVKVMNIDTFPRPIIPPDVDSIAENKINSILNTEVGETLILDHINFVGGQDIWLEESVPALEKLLETLLDNPTLEIEIQGHICCDAVDRENLSTKRALAIYKYLVQNGVEKKRLKYKGFGRNRPLINNPDETRNRRVEILILHK
jgi:outer membrane protein OmpA-like peptidoglycan-associated protein